MEEKEKQYREERREFRWDVIVGWARLDKLLPIFFCRTKTEQLVVSKLLAFIEDRNEWKQ